MSRFFSEPVDVVFSSQNNKSILPKTIIYKDKILPVEKVGLHHTYNLGDTLYHVYSLISQNYFLRLTLNSKTLVSKLEVIDNG